jgi:GTP-binding protein
MVADSVAYREKVAEADAQIERGRWLFTQECRFVAGVAKLEQIPGGRLPEVAFAGRSNVGKSSLVNALTGRRTLAKVSNTPGRTRQLNFFGLGGRLTLADLPGYGYARASKEQVANWTRLVELYLIGRAPLRRALLLVDSRHGLKDVDRRVMSMLDKAAVSHQVVLTKTDHLRPAQLTKQMERVADELAKHTAAHPEVMPTSAAKGAGIPELRAAIAMLIDGRQGPAA